MDGLICIHFFSLAVTPLNAKSAMNVKTTTTALKLLVILKLIFVRRLRNFVTRKQNFICLSNGLEKRNRYLKEGSTIDASAAIMNERKQSKICASHTSSACWLSLQCTKVVYFCYCITHKFLPTRTSVDCNRIGTK